MIISSTVTQATNRHRKQNGHQQSSRGRLLQGRPSLTNYLTIMMLALVAWTPGASAQQVRLEQAQMNVDDTTVSSNSKALFELSRNTQPEFHATWEKNACFILTVVSPYDSEVYWPFNVDTPPVCTSKTDGFTVKCDLIPASSDPANADAKFSNKLSFHFTDVQSAVAGFTAVRFEFTNFNTPFSKQNFDDGKLLLDTYLDQQCQQLDPNNDQVFLQSVQVVARIVPQTAVKVETSNKEIAYQGLDNIITFEFQPTSVLPPSGKGHFQLFAPVWYTTPTTMIWPYDQSAVNQNKCTCDCFTLVSSQWISNYLKVKYEAMSDACKSGNEKIVIKCPGYKNPMYQAIWDGFYVETYDNEFQPGIIHKSNPQLLDAKTYEMAKMVTENTKVFQITPRNYNVNSASTWTLALNPSIPLARDCYIKLLFPLDLEYSFKSATGTGIFQPVSGGTKINTGSLVTIPGDPAGDQRIAIKFSGCNKDASVGQTPFGAVKIKEITTQKAKMNSGVFGLEIYKDEDMSQGIATVTTGVFIPANKIKTGSLTNMKIYPLQYTVQLSTLLYIEFQTSHAMYKGGEVVIYLPPRLTVVDYVAGQTKKIKVEPLLYSTRATEANVVFEEAAGGGCGCFVVTVPKLVENEVDPANSFYKFGLSGIENQISSREAGNFEIITYFKNPADDKMYVTDKMPQTTSFVAKRGLLNADKDLTIDDPSNYKDNAVYNFEFLTNSMVPIGGFVKIEFPADVKFDKDVLLKVESCAGAVPVCSLDQDNSQAIWIKTTALIPKEGPGVPANVFKIGGVKNSRSFQPSGSFGISTYDEDKYMIDIGYNKNVATSVAGSITFEPILRDSDQNGKVTTYTFKFTTSVPMENGDILKFSFPSDISVNGDGQATVVTPERGDDTIIYGISGNDIQITFSSLGTRDPADPADPTNYNQVFAWKMTNIRNPNSLKESSKFANTEILTPSNYRVSFSAESKGVINTKPAIIEKPTLFQDSLVHSKANNYTITFKPINPLPADGSIKLVLPDHIGLKDGAATKCFVTTNKLFNTACTFEKLDPADTEFRVVRITDVFTNAAPYFDDITIMLMHVNNPKNNRARSHPGFNLYTYADKDGLWLQDQAENVMPPILACDWPCRECVAGDRTDCTACWQNDPASPVNPLYDLTYLMPYIGAKGQCKNECDVQYTSNGDTAERRCVQCDESCDDCLDEGKVDDTKACIKCSATHKYRLMDQNDPTVPTRTCLNTCNQGIFQKTLFQIVDQLNCGQCDDPCLGCKDTKTHCTSCHQDKVKKNLWQNDCIETCPVGTTSVAGECIPCASPCKTCKGSPDICETCDGTAGRSMLLDNTCYADCPLQYANDFANNKCQGCESGCDRCDVSNLEQCLRCGEDLFLYLNKCQGSCPETNPLNGMPMRGKDRVCVDVDDDLKRMWFPFIITAAIFTLVVIFGKLKKKAVLVHGKKKMISNQWTVVAIIACVCLVQTIAMIVQVAMAVYYNQIIVAVMSIAVLVAMVIYHILFFVWYFKKFYALRNPYMHERVTYKGREYDISSESQIKDPRFQVPVDKEFKTWHNKHVFPCWVVFIMGLLVHWKAFKFFYSRFYMLDMCKAKWTAATYHRTTQDKWGFFYLMVDIPIIIVGIIGLILVAGVINQLWITLVETIVITLYLIILQMIELYYMKQIWEYTEVDSKQKTSEEMKKYKGKKSKKLTISVLSSKIKSSSSNTFKTNKWEDLLAMFGGRRCKSMIELSTGWPTEEDPRKIKTWPISRDVEQAMEEAGCLNKKFGPDDAYALQDNCYAEGVHKLKGKDKNIQGDAAKLEFQNALNRKHGDLMAQLDEIDELHTRKGTRRRGRKNKYHNQIDLEDDQEIDPDEASDKDADLQIIKEQEEEEEALRKMVQESSKKQQEVTAARTQKIQQERLTREQRDERAQGELKLKQQQEAQAQKKQQMVEALRLQQEELQRKQLEEEAANILKQKELQEKEELAKKAKESEAARKQYEEDEAARLKRLEEEKRLKQEEEEKILQADLQRAKQEKEDALKKLEQERKDADARKLLENQMLQEDQERQRQKDKEQQKAKDEKDREERRQKEEADKLAKQIADEKAEQERLAKKEDDRTKEQDRKNAERAAKEAEKQKKLAEEKLEKEKRKQKEEEDRQAEKERLKLEKPKKHAPGKVGDGDEDDDSVKGKGGKEDLPAAATSVVKKESQKSVGKKDSKEDLKDKDANKKSQSELERMKSLNQSHDGDDMISGIVDVNQNLMKDFQQQQQQPAITIPPNSQLRTFNEHDVLGDLDRDDKGNIMVLEDKNGRKHDKQRKPVNQRGYLTDPKTNDVVENMTGQPMFRHDEMDERGEVPAPFCIEKHNFNPHQIMGDFDYSDGKPILMKTSQGFYIDKKARRVNNHGWFTLPNQRHIVDKDGRKKFDKIQLNGDDLHKLFNYNGKRFDIKDVMGQFDKDQNGNIVPQNNGKGQFLDNLGRLVNDKGYLIDEQGNIIDVNQKQIWKKSDLKSNEFPKIFPFTKFNIQRIQGDFEVNQNGTPQLKKTPSGHGYIDRKGRTVNVRGYLIDKNGNVVDHHGKIMFDKPVLEQDGEIPQVFRTGMLRSDTASSLSRLMSEIERGNQSEYGRGAQDTGANDSAYERLKNNDGDTSVDSKMEDTPANYNMANQRFDSDGNNEPINEEDDDGGEHMAPSDFSEQEDPTILIQKKKQKPKKKKKKPKMQTIEFLEPTNREKNMAGAYGGMARGEIRRPGIKYEKNRLDNSKKFRVSTADEPKVRAQLTELAKTTGEFPRNDPQLLPKGSKVTEEKPPTKKQGFMKASDGLSSHSQQRSVRGNSTSKNLRPPAKHPGKRGINDADFEQMFGKDIDQFLEDSEWDIESQDKVSQGSRASRASFANQQKLKAMEKVYLKRMEARPDDRAHPMGGRVSGGAGSGLGMQDMGKKRRPRQDVRGPDRETIIAVTDDPGVIHRGEILPFETKKTFKRR